MTKFDHYFVYSPDGDGPRKRHDTIEAAQAEAIRLAEKHPDRMFLILAPAAAFKARRVVIERSRFFSIVPEALPEDVATVELPGLELPSEPGPSEDAADA